MISNRAIATLLIVLSLSLQGIATSRLLCPPGSFGRLAQLRIACPPVLWPFTDYPMYSAPHRRGESLAFVEARIEVADRPPRSLGLYLVQPEGEAFGAAFAREESDLSIALEQELALAPPSARLAFERFQFVLTERGLVPAGEGASPR